MLLQVANYEGLPTYVHTSRICTFNPRTIARSIRNRRSSKVTNVFSSTSDWYGIVISAFRPRSETLAEVSCPSFSSFTRLDIDPGDTISSDCLTSLSLFNGMFILPLWRTPLIFTQGRASGAGEAELADYFSAFAATTIAAAAPILATWTSSTSPSRISQTCPALGSALRAG